MKTSLIKYLALLPLSALLFIGTNLSAQSITANDTIYINCTNTLHLVFSSQITYLDLSCPDEVAAKISSSRKNILAIRAKEEFEGERSLSVLLSEDKFCPYIIRFEKQTKQTIRDFREGKDTVYDRITQNELSYRTKDTTLFSRNITHLGVKENGLTLLCSNISRSSSGKTTFELTLLNNSSDSFQMQSIQIIQKRTRHLRNTLSSDIELIPIEIQGSLDCRNNDKSSMRISFDKLALRKDEYLEITAFEKASDRILSFSISASDLSRQSR